MDIAPPDGVPQKGDIVLFRVSLAAAEQINRRRQHAREHMDEHRANSNGVMVHVGNHVSPGDEFPMIITAVWGNTPQALVNGTVFLDGSDTFWATSVGVGPHAGMWVWRD